MRNFVFDLYGTLADICTEEHSSAFREAFLSEYGTVFGDLDFFAEYTRSLEAAVAADPEREPDVRLIFAEIAQKNGTILQNAEVEALAWRFRVLSRRHLALYPHVFEMLSELRAAGAKRYLLSNAQSCFTSPEIRVLGLDRMLDGIELSSDFGYKKPSGKFFRHILEKYHLQKEETVYIGNDLSADVIGAGRVGLTSVYIKTNISPQEDSVAEAKELAGYVVKDHAEMRQLLLSLVS